MTDVPTISSALYPCLGLKALGQCSYNPASPVSVYFSLGEAIGALGFTLAVQQLLKPIHRFRLYARRLSLGRVYLCVFVGAASGVWASLVPQFPFLHGSPFGYAILWELIAALLFASAYGAVTVAIVFPVRVRPSNVVKFTQASARLLSAAQQQDHLDYVNDLGRSLPALIRCAAFVGYLRNTSAFFDFIYRYELERGSYAASFLRIIADPSFCATLVMRAPWLVVFMLQQIANENLYAPAAEQFVRELARQAILRDDGMMEREVGYHGFGTAPLLSDALFSDLFIIKCYDPFNFFYLDTDELTSRLLKRFNSGAERCFATLIDSGTIYEAHAAFSISNFYKRASTKAWKIQRGDESDLRFSIEFTNSVELAIKMAHLLLAQAGEREYYALFITNPNQYRHDILDHLVEIVYEALATISNQFKGFDDPFWITAIGAFHRALPSIGTQPDGITPFQQRLMLKIIRDLQHNMRGYYPAICRVLLACVGPYDRNASQPNRTAFNILKDIMYLELQGLSALYTENSAKVSDFLPDNVSYDLATNMLIHSYRMGDQATTSLSALHLGIISLSSEQIRRPWDGRMD